MVPCPFFAIQPYQIAFLHTVTVLSRREQATCLRATKWDEIIEARREHHEVKLGMAEVAKRQRQCDTLQEYQRLDVEFLKFIRKDEEMRAKIARMIQKYFQEQKQ